MGSRILVVGLGTRFSVCPSREPDSHSPGGGIPPVPPGRNDKSERCWHPCYVGGRGGCCVQWPRGCICPTVVWAIGWVLPLSVCLLWGGIVLFVSLRYIPPTLYPRGREYVERCNLQFHRQVWGSLEFHQALCRPWPVYRLFHYRRCQHAPSSTQRRAVWPQRC